MSELNFRSALKAANNKEGKLTGLFKNSIYGICLNVKDHVLATHRELAMLRRCSEYLRDEPNRVVHIIGEDKKKHTNFIVNTLLHLGVSCGQITLNNAGHETEMAQGICLYVANK